MEKGFLTTKRRGSSKGVKENNGSVVNAPATVISGMDSGLVSSSVKSTLENLGDIVGKENEGLNSSPIGIASYPSVSFVTFVKGDTSRKSANVWLILLLRTTLRILGVNLVLSMMIKDMFFFKFRSKDGMESMLENVWVKFYDIPIIVFMDDGLSAIATELGIL
ncbi:hypothetical protein Tco_0657123, partial [Tanacetum coccineum]